MNINFKLLSIISSPYNNHFNTLIFNPIGLTIDKHFSSNLIYYHDDQLNEGNIVAIKENEDWKKVGIPYIVLYKKIKINDV